MNLIQLSRFRPRRGLVRPSHQVFTDSPTAVDDHRSRCSAVAGRGIKAISLAQVATILIVIANLLLLPGVSRADEPAERFLEALGNRRMFDTALDYLEQMETSRLVSDDFKRTIPFEKATILIDSASFIRDSSLRTQRLDQAQAYLDQFIQAYPNHRIVSIAKSRLANLLVQRASLNAAAAEQKDPNDEAYQKLINEARQQYAEASKIFTQTRIDLNDKLKAIDPNTQDGEIAQLRNRYQAEYLQTLLLLPAVKEQTADTYPEDAPERQTLLQEAAADYNEVADRYRGREAALYARIYQGRVNGKLGNYQEAVSLLQDILFQDATPAFLKYKKMALLEAVNCWNNMEASEERPWEIIAKIEPVLEMVSESDPDEDWLKLRLELAKAYRAAGQTLRERQGSNAEDRRQAVTYGNQSVNLARLVSKVSKEHRMEAQELLLDWGEIRSVTPTGETEPTTFAEARQRGRDLLDAFEAARLLKTTIQERLTSTNIAADKTQLNEQLQEAEATIEQAPTDALNYFEQALRFAAHEEGVVPDDVNSTRYFIAYILFMQKQYEKVGVLGEYMLNAGAQVAGARETCDLAMTAYWNLYNNAPQDNRQFELDMLRQMCDGVIGLWGGRAEAVKGATLMTWLENESGNLAAAEAYLNKIPENAPERYESEMALGQSLWKQYLNELKSIQELKSGGNATPLSINEAQTAANVFRSRAIEYLSAGAKRLEPERMDLSKAVASLSLAQAYVDSDQVDLALAHLENGKVGLLTLLENSHPAVQDPWIVINTYKTAVRAYIGALDNSSEKQKMIDKALLALGKLKSAVGDTEEGRKQLIGIYLGLATELKSQMDQLPTFAEKKTFAMGLQAFLEEIRQEATELNTMVWVASTLTGIGEAFVNEKQREEAKPFFADAATTYQAILERGGNTPGWLPDEVKLEVIRQLAKTYRLEGNYEQSIVNYARVLEQKTALVDVQMEAAMAYQAWGQATKSAEQFKLAMLGGEQRENPETKKMENVIWGWGKLGQITARYPNYANQFLTSRLNLARCRLEYGRLEGSDRQVELARRDLYVTYDRDNELGGPAMTQQYDALLREIQREMGETRPEGLAAFKKEAGGR